MDDRDQLLNDNQEAMRLVLEGNQVTLWTAIPAIVKSIDLSVMTCEVQPAIQAVVQDQNGVLSQVNLPLLVDVPIVFQSGGGFIQTFPIASGDEVLVVFSSRCIDAWWQSGGVQQAMEARMHDLSDGFAICGPKSMPKAANIPSVSSSKFAIRNNAGTVFLTMGSKFSMTNASTDLKTVLSNFQSTINTFMETLAGFAGGGSPVTQAMLEAPATTAVASLATLLTEIGALLE